MKKISILGCGWLGLPLAEYLILKGYQVKGSTTNKRKLSTLKMIGIEPFLINLNPLVASDDIMSFLHTDVLVVNIPPRNPQTKGLSTSYIEQIRYLLSYIYKSSLKELIFISSTSVYPNLNREVTERDAERDANPTLYDAEQLILKINDLQTTILRCAGLVGGKRVPGRFFAGKKNLLNGQEPANQVFRDDVIQVIAQIIRMGSHGEIYNVCAPMHPFKKDLYVQNAQLLGLKPPEFCSSHDATSFKVVNSDKIQHQLPYQFIYTNPFDFEYEL